MWKGPGQDPGGGPDPGPPGSSQELSDLQDQFEQQQVLIAQLKEMLRKSEQSSVTQEKVDEYMNTLSKRSGRAKKVKKDEDNGNRKNIPASQKIDLLRQQVEKNKLKLAERGKSQKGIEEMVTQLKAQLDDSQQLINQTPLNLSLQDSKTEYSENSSSQELYMVLLTKEKRITDLISKVQKLENNVLDLQENLKEKDSVIDARTKAITLMTENLSKKGKNTLDALDETKEQMRKMQENFVALESEMKARQTKLLDDLRLKNYEIADLEETNSKLKENLQSDSNNEILLELKERNNQLEAQNESSLQQLVTLTAENERLSTVIAQQESKINQFKLKESDNNENEELSKIKKQLDESNKNMIKVKAQHKSKVKELTKKIEAFKKISDSNAEIVKLEAENCRLSQKVAELEEEKGSLQLKLVESDSVRGSDFAERESELEEKIKDLETNLEEKDKIISLLELEITRSKNEIETLSEKLNALSHLENAQVTSEMASIQFEEQMDSLENEKKKIIEENENTAKELLETIENLKKEKQEISAKLEHYIQENMELIDKLEKLSAEKVSSAESIEIVEGLTQQEKLELEAYQKNLDMVGNLKTSEENIPQTVDLNESVNELTEETSELLQKIELFTVERREVMEKMEQLKQENNNLTLKIKEIENNRDVLAETYEQLQSEKEQLDTKLETLEKENEHLKEQLENLNVPETNKDEDFKQNLEGELKEEIVKYKTAIEEKTTEIERLQTELKTGEHEINQINNNMIDLNRALTDYENENKILDSKIKQLEEDKASLNQLLEKNQEELEVVSNTEWENRRLLESKDNEIIKLTKEIDNKESVISDLQKTLKEKDEKFSKISSDLKEKYLTLQKQLEDNSGNLQKFTEPLQAKVEELTVKNKEQFEKMKKIAANLKKKTQAYQEIEDKFKEAQDKHETEMKSLLQQLQDLESELSRMRQEHNNKTEATRVLEERNVELQNIIIDLKSKAEKANEVNLQEELLLTRENLGSIESSLQAKIQELEMIVETQESELAKSRERVSKLEEGIAFVEERRLSLERKANELGAQLEEKSVTCEEISRSEDFLEQRLVALASHDEAIEKKLEEAVAENQELSQQNKKLSEKNDKLRKKLEQVVVQAKKMENQQSVVEELEAQNENMKKQVQHLENEVNAYEKTLEENKNDFDKVNADWQAQFDQILKERTELMIRCERFEEELKEIAEKEMGFNEELIEYKTKLEKSETEIGTYEEEIRQLSATNQELENLREIIEEKDAEIRNYQKLGSNYEEQISTINEELFNLTQKIAEKDAQIEDYRQRVLLANEDLGNLKKKLEQQEQKPAQGFTNLASFFDNPASYQSADSTSQLREELAIANTRLEASQRKIEELQKATIAVSEAEVKVAPQESIPTFVWSGQDQDPFDFIEKRDVSQQQAPPQPSENTQQELLDKIKTLEFMLFNAEKDRDEALMQCHQLTSELTRLVYQRQPQAIVESQILTDSAIRDTPDTRTELRKIEFEETRPPVTSSLESGPVVEEIMQPKEAYLCFADDSRQIDLQVVSDADIADTPESRQQLQLLEFEETRPLVPATDVPVQEDPCSSKDAYLCFGENDDGWGWGPEEGKLEEEHAQKTEAAPSKQIDALKEKVRVLELERENHMEEIKQLQVKSGKLIKKLKEFKQKNEELSQRKKSEGDLFNLDDTIQEELKLQIQQVEKRLKETSMELDKEKNEKSAILKRVDVLTAANERMIEMKEKQDIELLGWQRNYRELNAKLERFEWGDDGFSSSEQPSKEKPSSEESNDNIEVLKKKIQELDDTIKELTLDNEELQTLLEEQRSLRISAEKSKSAEPIPANMKTEAEYLEIVNQLQLGGEEKKQLQEQLNELIKKNSELLLQFDDVARQNNELTNLISSKDEIMKRLGEQLPSLEDENNKLLEEKEVFVKELQEKNTQIDDLIQENEMVRKNSECLLQFEDISRQNNELANLITSKDEIIKSLEKQIPSLEDNNNKLLEEKEVLVKELQDKNAQIDNLIQEKELASRFETDLPLINELTKEKEVLFTELQEKNAQINALKESLEAQITSLRSELDNQTKHAQALLDETKVLTETVSLKDTELTRLSATMDQMVQEWEIRVDQRGNDVAESWKLHLEARETEFGQIEQLLKKEINELEEKCNALVNENNELRKNVDAEIRNEVDRVAALQQQINDRQQYINDLTRTLQEKQIEVESLQQELSRKSEELQSVQKGLDNEKGTIDAIFKVIEEITNQEISRDTTSLSQVLRDKEDKIVSLQREIQDVTANLSQLHEDYSKKQEELRVLNEQFATVLTEKDATVATLTNQLLEVQNLKDYESENTQNLQQNLLEYQQINVTLNSQLQMKAAQLEEKESEINNLKQLLEEKERERDYSLENLTQEYGTSINEQKQEIESLKRRLNDTENHYEEIIAGKDSEIEGVRLEYNNQSEFIINKNQEIENLCLQLNGKTAECDDLQKKIDEQGTLLEEENKQLTELRAIIEEQVLKIEELKKELYEKSNDYDSLIAEMDISRSSVKESETSRTKVEDDDLTEPVSRAELDLALYMLHQRDVRCEELTVELTQLLEERDTLQLRLSNVLREKEEMGRKIVEEDVPPQASASSGAVPKVRAEVALEAHDPLTTKLSELKTVGYRKDKTIVDEQELRRMQQLSIMQQHRDVASKLPPEAAARLVDASYTLSRDVQSPSKVLLNWLWGRSTPKVNNI